MLLYRDIYENAYSVRCVLPVQYVLTECSWAPADKRASDSKADARWTRQSGSSWPKMDLRGGAFEGPEYPKIRRAGGYSLTIG